MGWEIQTTVRSAAGAAKCRVLFESGEIVCRGALKRRMQHAAMRNLTARSGWLRFTIDGEACAIRLGEKAATWLHAIKNPRTRAQKLGAIAGMKTCVLGTAEEGACEELARAVGRPPARRITTQCALVMLFADEPGDLARLSSIEAKLALGGAVWVLWPKGRRDFGHAQVVAAAGAVGLAQTRSIGYSTARSGLRLVRRAAGRVGAS